MPNALAFGRNKLRNPSKSHEAQHRTAQAMNGHHGRHVPTASVRAGAGSGNLADQGKQERHGVIGNFIDAIIGNLGDHDSRCRGCRQIDVVHANSEARNDLALLHLANHVRIDLGIRDEQRIGIFSRRHDAFGVGAEAMRNSAPARETTARARSRFGNTESATATNRDAI